MKKIFSTHKASSSDNFDPSQPLKRKRGRPFGSRKSKQSTSQVGHVSQESAAAHACMEPPLKRIRKDIQENLLLESVNSSHLSVTSKLDRVQPQLNYFFSRSRLRVVSVAESNRSSALVYCMPKVTLQQPDV